MKLEQAVLPEEIIRDSFRIIDEAVGAHAFSAEEWPIVRRMIHASGDLELRHLVTFRNDATRQGVLAFQHGLPVITDVNMVAAGINRLNLADLKTEVHCFIDDADVKRQAALERTTRSYCGMKKALAEFPNGICVIGNAPTALTAVCQAVAQKKARPAILMAMPVGFVGVVESKRQALALDVPVIVVEGNKGGSAVAAAAVNALAVLALEARAA